MSTIPYEPTPAPTLEGRRWLDRLLAIELSVNAVLVAYAVLIGLAFVLHFWDLGARALHHDESLHATYSYYLYRGDGYRHDPLMHGPVLFHLTALMYLLFGVSDATARFSAAFAGTALVATPFFLRRWLGRWGALAAAAMLVVSPAFLYYSRFLREDVFVALWTALLFIGLWRYLQEGRMRWLYLAAGALALGFANKELTFMIAGVVLVYTDVLAAIDLSAPLAARYGGGPLPPWTVRTVATTVLIPIAWAVAAVWQPLRVLRRQLWPGTLPRSAELLLVMGTLTLPQLCALVQIPLKALHVDLSAPAGSFLGTPMTIEGLYGGLTVALLLLATLAAGVFWDWRRWLTCALIFYAIFICLFTTFFTNPNGFVTGIWGSLDYWLAQQGVQRGGQPVFYYLLMLPLYAYVPLVLAVIGAVYQSLRRGLSGALPLLGSIVLLPLIAVAYARNNADAIPLVAISLALAVVAVRASPLSQLLLIWFGGLLWGLSVAGEKMPWLMIHLELPLILLAGLAVNDLLLAAGIDARRLPRIVWLAAACAAGVIIVVPLAWGPGGDGVHAAITGIALLVAALVAAGVAVRVSRGLGLAVATAFLAGLLAPLSVRTAFALSYQHGDTPYEALVYTQSSSGIPKIMRDVEQYARQSGLGYNQPVLVDANDAFSWPWAWYLRDYHAATFVDLSSYLAQNGSRPPAHAILLVNDVDLALVQPLRGQYGQGIPYHHRWWFPEDYRGTTAASLLSSLKNGATWARWWGLLVGAHGIVTPPAQATPGVHVIGTVDATAFFPSDYVPGAGISASAQTAAPPKTSANGALTLSGPGGANGGFLQPAGVAVDRTGNVYVADSQNNRIAKFDPSGRLLAISTDTSAPGGFQEPWGVAVDRQGFVYVADTWNHRIVKLDSQLHFVTTWGYPAKASGPDSLLALYGPRDIAILANGNLLVTDTGNERVIEYTPDGTPVTSFGSAGKGPGQFQEPVGIAVAPDGTIYVADTWNNRIEVFDSAMHYQRSLPVPGWESHDVQNKPYLAILPNGDLLLTQPANARVVELRPDGGAVRTASTLGPSLTLARPIGVAADASGRIYVSDGINGQVTGLPASAVP